MMMLPTTVVTTSNLTKEQLSNSIAQSQDIVASPTISVPTMPNYIVQSNNVVPSHPNSNPNFIITDVTDEPRHHSADELELDDDLRPAQMNRRNSMSAMGSKQLLVRQLSNSSKSNESPSLPKRNQPITSSAPSTLNKAKPEEKAGEVFV